MFATPAYAQAANASSSGGGMVAFAIQIALLGLIFYFLLIRPQQRRAKAHAALIGGVKRGDVAVTSGGLVGKVTKVEETEIELEIAPNVRVRVLKGMLSDVRPFGTKPAND